MTKRNPLKQETNWSNRRKPVYAKRSQITAIQTRIDRLVVRIREVKEVLRFLHPEMFNHGKSMKDFLREELGRLSEDEDE